MFEFTSPKVLSQSPRFGSRCFVPYGDTYAEIFHRKREWSQSPRFGSRCFVTHKLRRVRTCPYCARVAIPSVRVSVFRLGPVLPERLGLPPVWLVAIPSVRVSVFRRVMQFVSGNGTTAGAEVAIPSVRVSVFRPGKLCEVRITGQIVLRVAIPSVRVSVFRLATNTCQTRQTWF